MLNVHSYPYSPGLDTRYSYDPETDEVQLEMVRNGNVTYTGRLAAAIVRLVWGGDSRAEDGYWALGTPDGDAVAACIRAVRGDTDHDA